MITYGVNPADSTSATSSTFFFLQEVDMLDLQDSSWLETGLGRNTFLVKIQL